MGTSIDWPDPNDLFTPAPQMRNDGPISKVAAQTLSFSASRFLRRAIGVSSTVVAFLMRSIGACRTVDISVDVFSSVFSAFSHVKSWHFERSRRPTNLTATLISPQFFRDEQRSLVYPARWIILTSNAIMDCSLLVFSERSFSRAGELGEN